MMVGSRNCKMSLIPSESYSFPDHFTRTISHSRDPGKETSLSPATKSETPRKTSFFLSMRRPVVAGEKNGAQPTANPDSSGEESSLPLEVPPSQDESPPVAAAKPGVFQRGNGVSATETPHAAGQENGASITAPARVPLIKRAIPPSLKPKPRWNTRAAPPHPTPVPIDGDSQIGPVDSPEPSIASPTSPQPAPPLSVVPSPPDNGSEISPINGFDHETVSTTLPEPAPSLSVVAAPSVPTDECSKTSPVDGPEQKTISTSSPEAAPLLCVVQSPPLDLVQMLLSHAARPSTPDGENTIESPSPADSPTLNSDIVEDAPAPVEGTPMTVRREFRLEMLGPASDL